MLLALCKLQLVREKIQGNGGNWSLFIDEFYMLSVS